MHVFGMVNEHKLMRAHFLMLSFEIKLFYVNDDAWSGSSKGKPTVIIVML